MASIYICHPKALSGISLLPAALVCASTVRQSHITTQWTRFVAGRLVPHYETVWPYNQPKWPRRVFHQQRVSVEAVATLTPLLLTAQQEKGACPGQRCTTSFLSYVPIPSWLWQHSVNQNILVWRKRRVRRSTQQLQVSSLQAQGRSLFSEGNLYHSCMWPGIYTVFFSGWFLGFLHPYL